VEITPDDERPRSSRGKAELLKKSRPGIASTVSLDSLDEKIFRAMNDRRTSRSRKSVEGIETAAAVRARGR